MKITKGQKLHVSHTRKGDFDAVALADFDTETTEFYPIAVAETHGKIIHGAANFNEWYPGSEIPCRRTLCTITVI